MKNNDLKCFNQSLLKHAKYDILVNYSNVK